MLEFYHSFHIKHRFVLLSLVFITVLAAFFYFVYPLRGVEICRSADQRPFVRLHSVCSFSDFGARYRISSASWQYRLFSIFKEISDRTDSLQDAASPRCG